MKRFRILVVEDDPQEREVFRVFLESSGFEVVETWNGEDAIRLAQHGGPDAIVLDIKLPTISGLTVAEVLKQRRNTKEIPIVAVSALQGLQAEMDLIGIEIFMPKPLDLENLVIVLRGLCTKDATPPAPA